MARDLMKITEEGARASAAISWRSLPSKASGRWRYGIYRIFGADLGAKLTKQLFEGARERDCRETSVAAFRAVAEADGLL
jgi:hypothetical protein